MEIQYPKGWCMNNPNDKRRERYEKKRKQKLVSFNIANPHDADLLAHANEMEDFSGWVKGQLDEDMKKNESSQ